MSIQDSTGSRGRETPRFWGLQEHQKEGVSWTRRGGWGAFGGDRAIHSSYCSVAKLCLTLCDPMDCSMPGFPVLHYLPESAQTHVYWVVMSSNHLILYCPLFLLPSIFPSIRVFSNKSVLHIRWQEYWSSASASVLPMNIEGWFPLGLTGSISLQPKGLSRVISSTTLRKHQFFGAQPFLWSNSHIHTWLLEKP